MSFRHLSDEEKQQIKSTVLAGLAEQIEGFEESDWLAQLVLKVARRSPRHMKDIEVRRAFEDMGEEPPEWSPRDTTWYSEVCPWTIAEVMKIREKEDFQAIEKIILFRDEKSFSDMIEKLNSQLKIKGMLYNRGASPEEEYPKVLSKIWEAMAKWDGRDFTAYIARTIKNYCIDRLKAKKKSHSELPEAISDPRPAAQTRQQAEAKDALEHVLFAIQRLEAEGTVGPLDGAIFALILKGRSVVQLVEDLSEGPIVGSLKSAHAHVAKGKKLSNNEALVLRYLVDGLQPDEVALLTQVDSDKVSAAAESLQPALIDVELTSTLCRKGLSLTELGRAEKLSANAVNLRVNRMRLKIWQALCEDSYQRLARRKNQLDNLDKAIVQHRCTAQNNPPCKMYKDGSCRAEAPLSEIVSKSGLSVTEEEVGERIQKLRDRVVDELGRMFPDYNSCMFERKLAK